MFVDNLLIIGYCLSFLVTGLWVALQLIQRKLFPKEFLYICSLAASLLIYYFVFFLYLFHPGIAHYFDIGLILISPLFLILIILSIKKSPALFKTIKKYYLPPLLIVGLLFIIYNSLLYGCKLPPGPNLDLRRVPNVTYCSIENMPLDNGLPQMFGDFILQNNPKETIITWSIADRPPVQIGATLPIDDLSRVDAQHIRSDLYNVFSIFLQLAWVGALWAILQRLKVQKRIQILLFIGFSATQFFYINSIFVWPKLLAAGLVLAGIGPYIGKSINKELVKYLPVAAVLVALGLMSHTGVIFTIIPFIFILLYKLLRFKKIDYRYVIAALILSTLILAPWQIYRDSITTSDRLVKYQLANVTSASDTRGTLVTIEDAYKQLTFNQWVNNKVKNVETLVTGNYKTPLGCWVTTPFSIKDCNGWKTISFFSTLFALEIFSLGIPFVIYQAVRKRLDSFDKESIILIAASLIIWVLAMFAPGGTVVHQGSYVTMILLFVLLGRSLARASSRLLILLVLFQLLIFYNVWIKPFHY